MTFLYLYALGVAAELARLVLTAGPRAGELFGHHLPDLLRDWRAGGFRNPRAWATAAFALGCFSVWTVRALLWPISLVSLARGGGGRRS